MERVIELLERAERVIMLVADGKPANYSSDVELCTEAIDYINDAIAELKKRKADIFKGILADDLSRFYNVKCKKCGWFGSSEFVNGGGAIADTGDYEDILCPACGSVDLEDMPEALPRWETPEQWEKRTGEPWPEDWGVYTKWKQKDRWSRWTLAEHKNARTAALTRQAVIVCAADNGIPPDGWRPEK